MLRPEVVAKLRSLNGGGSGWVNPYGITYNGLVVQPLLDTSGAQGESAAAPVLLGYITYPDSPGATAVGKPFDQFDTSGNYVGTYQFRDNDISLAMGVMLVAGAAVGFSFLGSMTGAAAATTTAAPAAAGAVGTLEAVPLMSTAGLEALPLYSYGGAAAGATAAAGAGSLSGIVNSGLSLVTKAIGAATALVGMQAQAARAGSSQQGAIPTTAATGQLGGLGTVALVVGLGVVAYLIVKD